MNFPSDYTPNELILHLPYVEIYSGPDAGKSVGQIKVTMQDPLGWTVLDGSTELVTKEQILAMWLELFQQFFTDLSLLAELEFLVDPTAVQIYFSGNKNSGGPLFEAE